MFELSPNGSGEWAEVFSYDFQGAPSDGNRPAYGLVSDKAQNLYGVTYEGGNTCANGDGCGVVFEVLGGALATPTTTALTSSLNPSNYGQPVTFTATVSATPGTPTGTVSFLDGGAAIGGATLNSSGVATFTTSVLLGGRTA